MGVLAGAEVGRSESQKAKTLQWRGDWGEVGGGRRKSCEVAAPPAGCICERGPAIDKQAAKRVSFTEEDGV